MSAPNVRVESKVYVIPGAGGAPASPSRRRKGLLVLVAGIVLLAGGAVGTASGLAVLSLGTDPSGGVTVAAFCGALGVAPGIVLLAYGLKERRHFRVLEEFAALLESYRRANPRDLARELGKSVADVQGMFKEASAQGLTRAYVDRATGDFVLYTAAGMEQFVDGCPGCGVKIQKWVFPDDTFRCPYCGTDIGSAVRAGVSGKSGAS